MGGKVRKAQIYIFIGHLAKHHTVEIGTGRLKGDGTDRNPLTALGHNPAVLRAVITGSVADAGNSTIQKHCDNYLIALDF